MRRQHLHLGVACHVPPRGQERMAPSSLEHPPPPTWHRVRAQDPQVRERVRHRLLEPRQPDVEGRVAWRMEAWTRSMMMLSHPPIHWSRDVILTLLPCLPGLLCPLSQQPGHLPSQMHR